MKRYEYHKATEIPWVSQVPSHWSFIRNANILTLKHSVVGERFMQYDLLSLTTGGIKIKNADDSRGKVPASFEGYQEVLPGDMVFCLFDLDCSAVFSGKSEYHGMITSAYDVAVPNLSLVSSSYLDYWFRAVFSGRYYKIYSKSVRYTINWDIFKALKTPVPPREEQDQIVRYLDWQMSKINRLIAAKRKQIALLHEQHKRRISEAVLHGNDDGCCQKDSGVEWIGMIPEHWSVIRCKYVFTERDERSIAGEEEHLSMSQKYGLVPDSKLDERRMLSETYVGGKICYKNDLVLNRLKAHLGVFALSPQKGVISPDYTVLVPNAERILPTYGEAVLKSDLCRRELRIRVRGIIEGFWRLYTDDFNTIVIPLPTLKEQRQIMEYIGALDEKSIVLKQNLEKEIVVLQDLRTRLISDVVTGQVDVRGIKVPDDEYINNEITEEEFEEESENNEEE